MEGEARDKRMAFQRPCGAHREEVEYHGAEQGLGASTGPGKSHDRR